MTWNIPVSFCITMDHLSSLHQENVFFKIRHRHCLHWCKVTQTKISVSLNLKKKFPGKWSTDRSFFHFTVLTFDIWHFDSFELFWYIKWDWMEIHSLDWWRSLAQLYNSAHPVINLLAYDTLHYAEVKKGPKMIEVFYIWGGLVKVEVVSEPRATAFNCNKGSQEQSAQGDN